MLLCWKTKSYKFAFNLEKKKDEHETFLFVVERNKRLFNLKEDKVTRSRKKLYRILVLCRGEKRKKR